MGRLGCVCQYSLLEILVCQISALSPVDYCSFQVCSRYRFLAVSIFYSVVVTKLSDKKQGGKGCNFSLHIHTLILHRGKSEKTSRQRLELETMNFYGPISSSSAV